MIHNSSQCPECSSWETERYDTVFRTDSILEKRGCRDCGIEYSLTYDLWDVEVTYEP